LFKSLNLCSVQKNAHNYKKQSGGGKTVLPTIFNALGDPTRFGVFKILSEKKDACVSDIANIMGISVPAASHHLKVLEIAGLAQKERMGQTICYRIKENETIVRSIMKLIR